MAFNKEIYKLANEKLDNIRERNQGILHARKNEIFDKIPEYKVLKEELIKLIGMTLSFASDKNKIAEIKENISENREAAEQLLLKNGYPKDYLDEIYSCPECHDKGYILNKKCSCFEKLLKEAAREHSNLNYIMETKNADSFDLNVFSDRLIEKHGISPRDNMKYIYGKIDGFAESFSNPDVKSMLFFGNIGLGKTFAASIAASKIIEKGFSVFYQSASKLFEILEDYKFNRRDSFYDLETVIPDIYESDLLIIDDLGTEFSTNYTVSAIYEVVNKRLIDNKKMVITTNLDIEALTQKYTSRLSSRIIGNFDILEFIGDDLRVENME